MVECGLCRGTIPFTPKCRVHYTLIYFKEIIKRFILAFLLMSPFHIWFISLCFYFAGTDAIGLPTQIIALALVGMIVLFFSSLIGFCLKQSVRKLEIENSWIRNVKL